MLPSYVSNAVQAPPPCAEVLQRARITARVDLSPELASALADLVYGADRRDDFALLASLTAERIGARCGR